MKKKIIKMVLIFGVATSSFFIGIMVSNDNHSDLKLDNMVNHLVKDENIVIKDNKGYILFNGKADKLPNKLKNENVLEYGSCYDEEFTTTFILRK